MELTELRSVNEVDAHRAVRAFLSRRVPASLAAGSVLPVLSDDLHGQLSQLARELERYTGAPPAAAGALTAAGAPTAAAAAAATAAGVQTGAAAEDAVGDRRKRKRERAISAISSVAAAEDAGGDGGSGGGGDSRRHGDAPKGAKKR